MRIFVDNDVAKVAEFMASNMPAAKLRQVAHAVAKYADLLWDHLQIDEHFRAFSPEMTSFTEHKPAKLE